MKPIVLQPDLSAGLVHQLDEVVIAFNLQAGGGEGSDECDDAPNGVHSIKAKQEVDVEVVGTTPEVLDSFNELIKFDHMYYKKPLVVKTPTVSNITAARSPNTNSVAVSAGNSPATFEVVSPKEMLCSPEECLSFSGDLGNVIGEEFGLEDPDLNRISELLDQLVSEASPKGMETHSPALFDTSDELFLDKVWELSYQTNVESEDNSESLLSDDLSSADRTFVDMGQIYPTRESVDSALELDYHSAPSSPDESCISSPSSDFESKPESLSLEGSEDVDLITETNYPSPNASMCEAASPLDSTFESTQCTLPDFLDDLVFSSTPEKNYNCSAVASNHCRPAVLLGVDMEYDNCNNSNWCNSEFDWGESCSDLNLDTDLFPSLYSLA